MLPNWTAVTDVTHKCDAGHFALCGPGTDLLGGIETAWQPAEEMISGFTIIRRRKESRIDPSMRVPYGLEIIENCVTCPHREDRLFCNLPPAAVQRLSLITSASSYPKGATLFVEGQAPRGVFILCAGRVKLSTTSADGKTLIVRISQPGEVLGLPGTVTGKPYELTAEVIEPTQANFISRADFLNFLREHGEVSLRVAQQLGETYHAAIAEMRSIGLSHSAGEKLARFLLDWCVNHGEGNPEIRATLTLTHEEIAQMIGASRETVTRLFADFKKKELLQIKGSTLIVRNKVGLESLAGS
jgi:CRP/FNR family cyclic AMP-dependent transcriptional regulator